MNAPVESLDDPRIAIYRNVKATNATRDSGLFVLEGKKLLERLLESAHFPVESVLATDRKADEIGRLMPASIPLYVVSHERISTLVGYHFHLGVLSCGRRVPWPDPRALARARIEATSRIRIIVCPDVQNPENLGAIVRLCDVFGFDCVLVGRDCPDPLSRRVLRVSMGSVLRVPVVENENLAEVVESLVRELGVHTVATVTDPRALSLNRFHPPDRLAVLFGNEGHGLSPEWIERCQQRLTIPMRPGAQSLNVAIAAGIIMHHIHDSQRNDNVT